MASPLRPFCPRTNSAWPGPLPNLFLVSNIFGKGIANPIFSPFYQGYEADHPNIELLKLKNFTVGKKLADEEVVGSQGLQRVADLVSCMVPFVSLAPLSVCPPPSSPIFPACTPHHQSAASPRVSESHLLPLRHLLDFGPIRAVDRWSKIS